jgi:hypothetical protein
LAWAEPVAANTARPAKATRKERMLVLASSLDYTPLTQPHPHLNARHSAFVPTGRFSYRHCVGRKNGGGAI